MRMTEHERERLLITLAADVAERRRGGGLKLNHPEAVAILTSFVFEGSRDGRTVTELISAGCEGLRRDDVLPGVPEMIDSVRVEATSLDGRRSAAPRADHHGRGAPATRSGPRHPGPDQPPHPHVTPREPPAARRPIGIPRTRTTPRSHDDDHHR